MSQFLKAVSDKKIMYDDNDFHDDEGSMMKHLWNMVSKLLWGGDIWCQTATVATIWFPQRGEKATVFQYTVLHHNLIFTVFLLKHSLIFQEKSTADEVVKPYGKLKSLACRSASLRGPVIYTFSGLYYSILSESPKKCGEGCPCLMSEI